MDENFEKQDMNRKTRSVEIRGWWRIAEPQVTIVDCDELLFVTSCTAHLITHCRTLTGAALTLRAWVGFSKSRPILRRNHAGPVKTIMSNSESMYRQMSPFFSCLLCRKTKVSYVYDCNQTGDNRKEDFETEKKGPRNFQLYYGRAR
jgi:hypothetical protein